MKKKMKKNKKDKIINFNKNKIKENKTKNNIANKNETKASYKKSKLSNRSKKILIISSISIIVFLTTS